MRNKIILLAVLFISTTMFGQLKTFSDVYTLNFGLSMLNGLESDAHLTGYNFQFEYDHFTTKTTLSGGFIMGYMQTNEVNNNSEVAYTTMPILVQGKYYPTPGRAVYLQGGFGIHFSRAEYLGPNRYLLTSDTGLMLLAGVGSMITIDETLFFNIAYNYNWLEKRC